MIPGCCISWLRLRVRIWRIRIKKYETSKTSLGGVDILLVLQQ
jgi:hypothetical protein